MQKREQLFGPDLTLPFYGTEAPPLPLLLLLSLSFSSISRLCLSSLLLRTLSLSLRWNARTSAAVQGYNSLSPSVPLQPLPLYQTETPIKVRQVKPRRAASKLGSVCALETRVLAITHVAARMVCPGSWLGRVHSSRHFYTRQRSRC